jgi:hypothetical protein
MKVDCTLYFLGILIPRLPLCCTNSEFGLMGREPEPPLRAPMRPLPVPVRARGLRGDNAPLPLLVIWDVIGKVAECGICASPVTRRLVDGLLLPPAPPEPE